MDKENYYTILEVDPEATSEEIKESHRKLIRKYHPDGKGKFSSEENSMLLNQAYDVLKDDKKRKAYDEEIYYDEDDYGDYDDEDYEDDDYEDNEYEEERYVSKAEQKAIIKMQKHLDDVDEQVKQMQKEAKLEKKRLELKEKNINEKNEKHIEKYGNVFGKIIIGLRSFGRKIGDSFIYVWEWMSYIVEITLEFLKKFSKSAASFLGLVVILTIITFIFQ